jgi:hypothetical protein
VCLLRCVQPPPIVAGAHEPAWHRAGVLLLKVEAPGMAVNFAAQTAVGSGLGTRGQT